MNTFFAKQKSHPRRPFARLERGQIPCLGSDLKWTNGGNSVSEQPTPQTRLPRSASGQHTTPSPPSSQVHTPRSPQHFLMTATSFSPATQRRNDRPAWLRRCVLLMLRACAVCCFSRADIRQSPTVPNKPTIRRPHIKFQTFQPHRLCVNSRRRRILISKWRKQRLDFQTTPVMWHPRTGSTSAQRRSTIGPDTVTDLYPAQTTRPTPMNYNAQHLVPSSERLPHHPPMMRSDKPPMGLPLTVASVLMPGRRSPNDMSSAYDACFTEGFNPSATVWHPTPIAVLFQALPSRSQWWQRHRSWRLVSNGWSASKHSQRCRVNSKSIVFRAAQDDQAKSGASSAPPMLAPTTPPPSASVLNWTFVLFSSKSKSCWKSHPVQKNKTIFNALDFCNEEFEGFRFFRAFLDGLYSAGTVVERSDWWSRLYPAMVSQNRKFWTFLFL